MLPSVAPGAELVDQRTVRWQAYVRRISGRHLAYFVHHYRWRQRTNMSDPRKLRTIEGFGKEYVQLYLADGKVRRNAIVDDPLEALFFFYSKAFMRGRRDEVSVAFKNRTLGVLWKYRTAQDIDLESLDAQLWRARVNNRYDRQMVIGSIGLVCNDIRADDYKIYLVRKFYTI